MTGAAADKAEGPAVSNASETAQDRVGYWVTKGFLGLIAVCISLLVTFGGWLVVNVNQIHYSTSILQTEFSSYKSDISGLKSAVDGLRIRGEGWATKDSLTTAKDDFRVELSKIKDQVNLLEVRMTREESNPAYRR